MEGLLKESSGGVDHLSVGVQLPSGTVEKPMKNNVYTTLPPGKYLNDFVLECFFSPWVYWSEHFLRICPIFNSLLHVRTTWCIAHGGQLSMQLHRKKSFS